MNFSKRYLLYETNSKGDYIDYGEIMSIVNDKMINVNMSGQRDKDGNLVILEAVMIQGDYVPKIGDWVGVEWRNGQPIAIGNNNAVSSGLRNINDDVKVVSQSDLAGNVINSSHIRTDSIEARHISANTIEARHITADSIDSTHIIADAINADHISANAIQSEHISSNSILGRHISANTIESQHISANSIQSEHLTVSGRKSGLIGQYFTHSGGTDKFIIFKGTRVDEEINFDWTSGSPSLVGQADNFAVRWQGMVFAPQEGQYIFFLDGDEGVKLWIDNELIIDSFVSIANERSGVISLNQNKWYTVRIDYFENSGNAKLIFKWQPPSTLKEVVPSKYLTQATTVVDGGTILTNTITAGQIEVGTITAVSGIIADAAIQTAHIGSGSITSAKISNAAITTAHIASGNITDALIANATITNAKIATIDAVKITTGYLSADRISANSIIGSHISANTITGDKIAGNTIEGDRIKASTITTLQLAAQSITSDKIQAGSITGDSIRASSITAEHISTAGLDANLVSITGQNGETLIGGGYLRVGGLDVGVVQSDNLVANGLFLTASSSFGQKRMNPTGDAILGTNENAVGKDQIWKIDLSNNTYTGIYININGKKPSDIAIDSNGTYAYATVEGDNTLVQIDLANNIIGKTLSMGNSPRRVKYTGSILEDMKHLFILNTDPKDERIPDTLMIVDSPPNSVGGDLYLHHTIPVGNGPYDFTIDSKKWMYMTQSNQGDIAVFDMSSHDSTTWKIKKAIPIAAFGTDNYHGGLEGTIGLNGITGGDSAGQYDTTADAVTSGDGGGEHGHGGYGSSDGSLKTYTPKGIEQSTDIDTLYTVDSANNELVIVDKYGKAPYNGLTGTNSSSSSPEDSKISGVYEGGGPTTPWVRYRIPIGDNPNFVKLYNGKIFVSLDGSGKIAIIDEQDILDEIALDREYYGDISLESPINPFSPMRALPTFIVRTIDVGSKPSYMEISGTNLIISLTGQNQVVIINTATEMETARINVGANPMGIAVSGQYLYVVNNGAGGVLSFIYPEGDYIGDPYIGLEGGIEYQGAEYWVPNRSDWRKDASGNIIASSTVEFRVNEPFLNEGGYSKITAQGKLYQEASIEQDIFNVSNFSNGNNLVEVQDDRVSVNFSGNILYPKPDIEWTSVSEVTVWESISGNNISTILPSGNYTVITGSNSRIDLVNYIVPSGNWVTADYIAKNNVYFKDHVGSVLLAVENSSTENYNTVFEIDEYVPKFVAFDNQQTELFTPTTDGINEEYTGLEYSHTTNRALNLPSGNISYSGNINTGTLDLIVNNDTTSSNNFSTSSGNSYVQLDLGYIYMVPHLHIWHYYDDGRSYNTKLEVSEDGITWEPIYDSSTNGTYAESAIGKMHMFNAKPVRYVRDWLNGSTVNTSNHWVEIKVYGDWKVETGYTYPVGSTKSGQQIATNGSNVVTTNISKAYVAFDIATEFTSWWYMTYLIGPEFGTLAIEMPTLMNSNHFLQGYNADYVNKVAHRHIMSFPPSNNIMADSSRSIKAGKHRAIIRQESGKVSLDRIRVEDFQYYARNSLLIPSQESSTTFRPHRLIAQQTKWYEGMGIQSTEGAYDEPRRNPDTGIEDKSVPIKYRFRIKSTLNLDANIPSVQEERGTTYITSIVMETGKQRSFWRRSESSDSFPASRIESWDSKMPHKTGIQTHHIANGSIRGTKILAGAIMDYHISPYAKIEESKLQLKYPTHQHGRNDIIVGGGPLGTDLHVFYSNKDFLDSLTGFAGISGNYGTGNTVSRGDHVHNYLPLSGGNISGTTSFLAGINITGDIIVTGTVDGVDVSALNTTVTTATGNIGVLSTNMSGLSGNVATISGSVYGHIGSGGTAHPIAVSSGNAGFISGANQAKLDAIQINAINQTTTDGLYLALTGGTISGQLTHTSSNPITFKSTTYKSWIMHRPASDSLIFAPSTLSGGTAWDWAKQIEIKATGDITLAGQAVWHAGNFTPSNYSLTTHNHNSTYLGISANAVSATEADKVDGLHASSFLRTESNQTSQNLPSHHYHHLYSGDIVYSHAFPSGTDLATKGVTKYNWRVANGAGSIDTLEWGGADRELKVKGNKVWHSGNFVPSNYYLKTEVYAKTETYNTTEINSLIADAGDIKAGQANTFNYAGLSVKIQPSANVTTNTKLFQINDTIGTELVSVDYEGDMIVKGNLTVQGTTQYAGTTTVDGDYTITGTLGVSGNTTLGDTISDQTTINGTLLIPSGSLIKQIGREVEVMRFPVYGIGGDLQFQTDSIAFETIITHYWTFASNSNSCLSVPPTDATRTFKLLVVYSTSTNTNCTVRVVQSGTTTEIKSVPLPSVGGDMVGTVRTLLSSSFTTTYGSHTQFQAKADTAGALVIKYIEVIAYDTY